MRINKYLASASGMSRRAADQVIQTGRVTVNGQLPTSGQDIAATDQVSLDGAIITPAVNSITIMLNKPAGYVCSRNGQGSATIYDLLPSKYHRLKPIGRLDKDSSGLLLLTNNGSLANQLTHPSHGKTKVYQIHLNTSLAASAEAKLQQGVPVEDYVSQLNADQPNLDRTGWRITMTTGRNRQIRRTFQNLGYTVTKLHRSDFGPYSIGNLADGKFSLLSGSES